MLVSFYWDRLLWIDMWLESEENFLYLAFNQLTLNQLNDLTYVTTMIYISDHWF